VTGTENGEALTRLPGLAPLLPDRCGRLQSTSDGRERQRLIVSSASIDGVLHADLTRSPT